MCLFRSMISLHGLPYALRGMYIHLEAKRRTGAATLMATGSILGGSWRGYRIHHTVPGCNRRLSECGDARERLRFGICREHPRPPSRGQWSRSISKVSLGE